MEEEEETGHDGVTEAHALILPIFQTSCATPAGIFFSVVPRQRVLALRSPSFFSSSASSSWVPFLLRPSFPFFFGVHRERRHTIPRTNESTRRKRETEREGVKWEKDRERFPLFRFSCVPPYPIYRVVARMYPRVPYLRGRPRGFRTLNRER